ncbi:MAG: V-type proton ATPase subunit E [Promethearchaeota archaeon]|nr:MAG: V-type proton ATPase subunit E [Candidatus Lokiarchaeota archaeon]
MSEKELKERFGNLGMYLIEKAQKKVKDMNQQTLFRKAEIKKKYKERTQEEANKIKTRLVKQYKEKLNTSLSSTLLDSKEKLLNLKNTLAKMAKEDLIKSIKEGLNSNFNEYLEFLIRSIKKEKEKIDNPPKVIIKFNKRDFQYFNENKDKLTDLFENPIELVKSKKDFIGGFIIKQKEGILSYNNTLKDLLEKNKSIIEKNLSDLISESRFKEIEMDFKNFIENKKSNIENELRRYDRI